jgi:hypothetical protein
MNELDSIAARRELGIETARSLNKLKADKEAAAIKNQKMKESSSNANRKRDTK